MYVSFALKDVGIAQYIEMLVSGYFSVIIIASQNLGKLYTNENTIITITYILALPQVHKDLALRGWHTATNLSNDTVRVRYAEDV